MVVRQFGGKQFILATRGLEQLEFSYKDSTTPKEIDQVVKSWKQTFRVNTSLVVSKVTSEYAVWRVRRPKNLVTPLVVEGESAEEIP